MPAIQEKLVTSPNLHTQPPGPGTGWIARRTLLTPLLLLIAAFATYGPALRNDFVWDDHALVLRDPLIRSWRLIWEGFQHFLFTDAAASDFYRPLQRLSYTLDYTVFFVTPMGYHFVSVLWHAAAAIALFYFARDFLGWCNLESGHRWSVAFLAALVWLLHPVQSSAVIYIAGRADSLAATFGFLGLVFTLRMLNASRNARWLFGIGGGVCFLASALSKEAGLIFLLIWLLIALAHRSRGTLLGAVGMIAAVLIAYLSLRLSAEQIAPPPPPFMPLVVRPILIARAIAEYAGLIVFPLRLHMERDVATHPFGFAPASLDLASWRELQTLLGYVLIAAAVYGLWRTRKRPAIFYSFLFAAISYLPVSGLVPLNATVAEHWLYLPSAFLFIAASSVLIESRSRIAYVCLTIWILFLPIRTFIRTFDWRDQRTFLTRTVTDGGDSARMWINLGCLELGEGHLAAARDALEKALAKEPDNALAQLNLAAVKVKRKDFSGARAALKKVTEPPELRAQAEETLAVIENRETGKVNLMRLRLAARLGATNWLIEQRYVKALADVGAPDRAMAELKACLAAAPYRSESWLMMSDLLRKSGRPNEASIAIAEAERTDFHLHDRLAGP